MTDTDKCNDIFYIFSLFSSLINKIKKEKLITFTVMIKYKDKLKIKYSITESASKILH